MTPALKDTCRQLRKKSPMMAHYLERASENVVQDARTAVLILRQFVEVMADWLLAHCGKGPGIAPREVSAKIETVRPNIESDVIARMKDLVYFGNRAAHDHDELIVEAVASRLLGMAWNLAGWFISYCARYKEIPAVEPEAGVLYCPSPTMSRRRSAKPAASAVQHGRHRFAWRDRPLEPSELFARRVGNGGKRTAVLAQLPEEVVAREWKRIIAIAKNCARDEEWSEARQAKASRSAWNDVRSGEPGGD